MPSSRSGTRYQRVRPVLIVSRSRSTSKTASLSTFAQVARTSFQHQPPAPNFQSFLKKSKNHAMDFPLVVSV